MYELTFTFRLADLVRYEVRSKQRSDHPLVIQCLVTERLVTERSHYKFSRITKRSMYDTYVRNDNVNALYDVNADMVKFDTQVSINTCVCEHLWVKIHGFRTNMRMHLNSSLSLRLIIKRIVSHPVNHLLTFLGISSSQGTIRIIAVTLIRIYG